MSRHAPPRVRRCRPAAGPSLAPVTAEFRRLTLLRKACGQGGHVAVLTAVGRDVAHKLQLAREEVAAHG